MQNNLPLVTVITPSYNHVDYIEQAIESVARQTYKNIEYFIVDDGSTDGTHELFVKLKKEYPQFIFEVHKENRGHIRFSETVAKANGKYICWLSSDDWYLPEKIEKQVNLIESLPEDYGVVYSGGLRYFMDTKTYREPATNKMMRRGRILKELLTEPFFIYPITPMVKKECFDYYSFSPKYRAEGEAIYFKIAMRYKFDYVDEPLVVMRDHSGNIGKEIHTMLEDNINARKELFSHPDFPEDLKYLKNKIISRIYFLKGWEMIRLKNLYKSGFENLKKAFILRPKYIFNPRFLFGILYSFFKK
ncbi:glycosyltransferase family 2 protein [Salinimicrobium sp. CAU 1759]